MDHIDTLLAHLDTFIRDADGRMFGSSRWLQTEPMEIYVRKSFRRFPGTPVLPVLDLANIQTHDETKRGQGGFTRFLAAAERTQPWAGVFIENVLEPRFGRYFSRQGFATMPRSVGVSWPDSFYRLRSDFNFDTVPPLE